MSHTIPSTGAATPEQMHEAHRWWIEAAKAAKINMKGFKPNAPLAKRKAWAARAGLEIATMLSRYSTKLQRSTESQIRQNVEYAARKGMYLPPEYICVDEAQKGRRQRRDGLNRVTLILGGRHAQVLLVFKVSRLLRTGYLSFKFVQENVADEGLRAISISQGIDTSDLKTWKGLLYLHGMMDDMLLDTIGDHSRAELESLFQNGYVTGALTVGYVRVEVPGAPLTKRGLPRTRPAVDEKVAKLINQHFDWILDGMSISEGHRRWLKAGGPCDPRSTLGYMSRQAYRRMLSKSRYTGLWAFGRKRNRWSAKRDYTTQVDQPETEVKIVRAEELRIVSDEKFLAMQKLLTKLKTGPHGPRTAKLAQLWDLTTKFFHCAHGKVRLHQTGAGAKGMQCKRGDACPCLSAVKRKEAVQAVCKRLRELITRDHDNSPAEAVEVWLRMPPFLDRYAERARQLVDVEGHSYRSAAKVMQSEGLKLNSGKVWQLRKRYHEMIGQAPPDRPYNGGEPRQSL